MTAPLTLTKLAARQMVDTVGRGAVVNISSRSASMTQTMFVAYGAAKAALDRMTRNIAPELAPRVRVNAIDVGGVATRSLDVVLTDDDLRATVPRRHADAPARASPRTSPARCSTWCRTPRRGSPARSSRSTAAPRPRHVGAGAAARADPGVTGSVDGYRTCTAPLGHDGGLDPLALMATTVNV